MVGAGEGDRRAAGHWGVGCCCWEKSYRRGAAAQKASASASAGASPPRSRTAARRRRKRDAGMMPPPLPLPLPQAVMVMGGRAQRGKWWGGEGRKERARGERTKLFASSGSSRASRREWKKKGSGGAGRGRRAAAFANLPFRPFVALLCGGAER